jgi:hypothetical protein
MLKYTMIEQSANILAASSQQAPRAETMCALFLSLKSVTLSHDRKLDHACLFSATGLLLVSFTTRQELWK